MNDRLFNHVDIRPWNTNVLNGKAVNPQFECQAYEQKVPSPSSTSNCIFPF